MKNLKGFLFLFAMIAIFSHHAFSQSKIRVWEGVESLSKEKKEILIYPASSDNNNGAAVIICPGGSYHHLGVPHEGIKTNSRICLAENTFIFSFFASS